MIPLIQVFHTTILRAISNRKTIDVKQGIYYGWKDRDFQKQENQIGTIKLSMILLII
jgi:outer membrane receptor for monomeric catechols